MNGLNRFPKALNGSRLIRLGESAFADKVQGDKLADYSVPIEYTNRRGEKYYIHVGETKTGKPKYYVALHAHGSLADVIPDGFEIYEGPNGQVSLRKVLPKVILDDELAVIERELGRIDRLKHCKLDRKLEVLTVYLADEPKELFDELVGFRPWRSHAINEAQGERFRTYEAQLQFVLVNQKKRVFQTRRYCYLGRIDDWIDIGDRGPLAQLAKLYIKHLGQESYYELF